MVGPNLSVEILKAQRQIRMIAPRSKVSSHSSQLPIWPHQKLVQKTFNPEFKGISSPEPDIEIFLRNKSNATESKDAEPEESEVKLYPKLAGQQHPNHSSRLAGRHLSPRWSASRPNSPSKEPIFLSKNTASFEVKDSMSTAKVQHSFPVLSSPFRVPRSVWGKEIRNTTNIDDCETKMVDPKFPLWWNREGLSDKSYVCTLRDSLANPMITKGSSITATAKLTSSVRSEMRQRDIRAFQHKADHRVKWDDGDVESEVVPQSRSGSTPQVQSAKMQDTSWPLTCMSPEFRKSLTSFSSIDSTTRKSRRDEPRPPPFALDIPS